MAEHGSSERIGTLVVGLLFCGVAAAIVLLVQPLGAAAMIAAGVIGGLGLDALVAAWRGRRSLLSRLGPLP